MRAAGVHPLTNVKEVSGQSDKIIAAIDLGSNSIKMTVAEHFKGGKYDLREFLWKSEIIRIGQGIDQSGELAQDRIDAALETLNRFAREAREAKATRLIGVATEATRVARNGAAFLKRVSDETGIEIKAISGDQEASLTFLGLHGVVDLTGVVLIADIGGASSEIVIARSEKVEWSRSFAIGSGRMTDRLVPSDPPTESELQSVVEETKRVLADAPMANAEGGRLIVVGGTGEYLERLIPNGAPRTAQTLERVLSRLTNISAQALADEINIPLARARVLPAGIAIARSICGEMRPISFEAAESGIRRGLLLAAFAGEI
jgi:exopolyphosphatase/guanosine-5'-triphosphate,3'-diphosphate pyrophosphatase